jgi:cytochrome c oxidase cbb3-type subunit 3
MRPLTKRRAVAMAVVAALTACSSETRPVGAELPRTPPTGSDDPRIDQYKNNAYQISQGGRYYVWYGCATCHASGSGTAPDLASARWQRDDGFDAVYASIAHAHAGRPGEYEGRIPVEQLWQIAAYVRGLPTLAPEKRRRQDIDMFAEPQYRIGPKPW